jgi:hypothetical protein
MRYIQRKKHKLFGASLIETAIVILLMAGMIAGTFSAQTIIQNSKMNALIAEMGKVSQAYTTFVKLYKYSPGDLPNAGTLFGTECTSPNGGCDGDGDGEINTNTSERRNSTWHLAFAGLYNGKRDTTTGTGLIPEGFEATNLRINLISPNIEQIYSSTLKERAVYLKVSAADGQAGLSVKQANYIDRKIDDGDAYLGKVIATNSWGQSNQCVTATSNSASINDKRYLTATSGPYRMSETAPTVCRLYYRIE